MWGALAVATAGALEMSPEYVRLSGKPGERVRADLVVVNTSSNPVVAVVEARAGDGSPAAWFSLSPRSVRLSPGARRTVRLKAIVPNATGEVSGEVWGRLTDAGLTETRVVRRVTLTVSGTEKYEGALEGVGVDFSSAPVVSAVFRNSGNVSLRPKFILEWAPERGDVPRWVRDASGEFVAPGTEFPLVFELEAASGPWSGRGTLSAYFRDGTGSVVQISTTIPGDLRAVP